MQLKRFHIGIYELAMFALLIIAVTIRFILIRFHWPVTSSDEATIDLMALHIAYRGEHPIFYYGQDYMGAFEAYIGAFLLRLFGVSIFTVRLGLLPLFALFLVCMYVLTRMLYGKGLALFTVALLSLGSNDLLSRQLQAIGGYPEILAFGAIILLCTYWLVRSASRISGPGSPGERWKRGLLYGLLGLVIGLSLWVDLLLLPCIAAAALLLFCFCRHELRRWNGLLLACGVIIGAWPLILYNLSAPPALNSLAVLSSLHTVGAQELAARHITLAQRLASLFQISIPVITGANPCHWLADFAPRVTAQSASGCALFQTVWGTGFLVLWTLSCMTVGAVVWHTWRAVRHLPMQDWPYEERKTIVLKCGRLMLLLSAALTIVAYVTSSAAALYPWTSSRYLLCLLFTTPALLWPLWQGVTTTEKRGSSIYKSAVLLRVALLLFIMTTFLVGTISTLSEIPAVSAAYARQQTLASDLLRIGATRIYSEYWTCNRLIFQTREQIICAVLNDQLGQGFDRYKPYRALVHATPHPAYVFPVNSAQAQTFVRLHGNDTHYRRYVFGGYVVYQYVSGHHKALQTYPQQQHEA
jgi:hypothetical protein